MLLRVFEGGSFSDLCFHSGIGSDLASAIFSCASTSATGMSVSLRAESSMLGVSGCICDRSSRTSVSFLVAESEEGGSAWPRGPAAGNLSLNWSL